MLEIKHQDTGSKGEFYVGEEGFSLIGQKAITQKK